MHFNIINPEIIDVFLKRDCPELSALLVLTLRRALKAERSCLRRLDAYPPDAPSWLTPERFAQGEAFYRWVGPNADIMRRIVIVEKWLALALADDAAWLHAFDPAGRLRKLLNIGTLEHAFRLASKEIAARRRSNDGAAVAGTALVQVNANGTRWVRLLSRAALRREGFLMRHCLGNDTFAEIQKHGIASFYSLRDATGAHPRVTVSAIAGRIHEAHAFANREPRGYRQELKALSRALRRDFYEGIGSPPALVPKWRHLWTDDDMLCQFGWIAPAQTAPARMPRRLLVPGSMDLSFCEGLLVMPDVLTIVGDLKLAHSRNVRMPRWLRVKGNVDLTGCNCVHALPRQCLIEGDLNLTGCAQLRALPDGLKVGGWLTLTGTGITRLPSSVRVGRGVSFTADSHFATALQRV